MPKTIAARRAPGSPETRATILRAAEHIFAEQGLAGARTDAIAAAAGVNKALLYYYFPSKEGLYCAVLDGVFSGLRRNRIGGRRPAGVFLPVKNVGIKGVMPGGAGCVFFPFFVCVIGAGG